VWTEADVQPRRSVFSVERPGDVGSHRTDRGEPAGAEAGPGHRLEAVVQERVAAVGEHRDGPGLAHRMLVLDACVDQAIAADQLSDQVARPQGLVVVAANAV